MKALTFKQFYNLNYSNADDYLYQLATNNHIYNYDPDVAFIYDVYNKLLNKKFTEKNLTKYFKIKQIGFKIYKIGKHIINLLSDFSIEKEFSDYKNTCINMDRNLKNIGEFIDICNLLNINLHWS